MPEEPLRPMISIVVPTFNHLTYLPRALDSITSQDADVDVEILVFDGGSTDGTADYLATRADEFAYWQSMPDGGQSSALAAGFAMAKGTWLAWLNADDELADGALDAFAWQIRHQPEAKWVVGESWTVTASGVVIDWRPARRPPQHAFLSGKLSLPQESTFFRRDLYDEVGGIDPRFDMAMDFDLFLRFWTNCRPECIYAPLGIFRVTPGQKSGDVAAYQSEVVASLELRGVRVVWWRRWLALAQVALHKFDRLSIRAAVFGLRSTEQSLRSIIDESRRHPGVSGFQARVALRLLPFARVVGSLRRYPSGGAFTRRATSGRTTLA